MDKKILFFSIVLAIVAVIFCRTWQTNTYALTEREQRNLIGFSIGCKDGLADKEPYKTQYDKVGGFSTHSIDYNTGNVEGFNSCSKSFQIDDAIEPQ